MAGNIESVTNESNLELTGYISAPGMEVNARRFKYLGVIYTATGDGTTDDTTALQAAINMAIANDVPLYLPPGTYKTTAELTANSANFAMYGAGGGRSQIKPASNTAYNGLVIGPGSGGSGVQPSGYLRDLQIIGPSSNPSGFKAALQLSGMRQFETTNVYCSKFSIGFDLINNCYGCTFYNLRTLFGECNVGLNLRTGTESGSDMQFYNCWLGGNTAAVHISGGTGGYTFVGGQLAAGQNLSAASDTSGSVIIGKDYVTAALARSNGITFLGTSFEGTGFAWCIRTFAACGGVNCYGVGFNPANVSAPAIGIIKGTGAADSRWAFHGCNVQGYFDDPLLSTLISVAGQGTDFQLDESLWHSQTPATINGGAAVGSSNWMWNLANYAGLTLAGVGIWCGSSTGSIGINGTQILKGQKTGYTTDPTGTLTRTTFISDSVTLPNLAARVAALIVDLRSHGLIGA